MFLQHAKFKKLLKDAAKGSGFLMAYDKEGYYLEGSWWRAYIDQSTMDKETKSVIIAVSGEFPNTASFRVLKEYNQYTMKEPEDIQKYKEMPVPSWCTGYILLIPGKTVCLGIPPKLQ